MMSFIAKILVCLAFCALVQGQDESCSYWNKLSRAGIDAFVERFYVAQSGVFAAWSNDSKVVSYWNQFVALHCMATGWEATNTRDDDLLNAFVASYDAQGWLSHYYDDMDWAVEALARANGIASESTRPKLQAAATTLGLLISNARDDTCCGK
jgi:predicted alpha-1,6-mannanase (GH76 family)